MLVVMMMMRTAMMTEESEAGGGTHFDEEDVEEQEATCLRKQVREGAPLSSEVWLPGYFTPIMLSTSVKQFSPDANSR
eukprot:4411930-Pyramimonas_sp.AAC.1